MSSAPRSIPQPYRYVALLWDARDDQALATVEFLRDHFMGSGSSWESAWSSDGIFVLHTGDAPDRMHARPLPTQDPQRSGVILGSLFQRETEGGAACRPAEIDPAQARSIIDTEGQWLIDQYWGAYVAFFRDPLSTYILVDPSGMLNCFRIRFRNVDVHFSHMADASNCPFIDLAVDWLQLASRFDYRRRRTGVPLQGVRKILPGESLQIRNGEAKSRLLWNPYRIAGDHPIDDPDQAVRALRNSILSATATLAAPYSSVMLAIGGLDSSILLAALSHASAPFDVTCIHQHDPRPEADEADFVRETTTYLQTPLVEYETPPMRIDFETLASAALTAAPSHYLHFLDDRNILAREMTRHATQAMISGFGGDEILYSSTSGLAAFDYLRMHGPSQGYLQILAETASLQGRSVEEVLADIQRGRLGSYPGSGLNGAFNLLHPGMRQVLSAIGTPLPWTDQDAPPGKREHIWPLLTDRFDIESCAATDTAYTTLFPLLTQPVVETCLRIPTWLLVMGGINRGLARKAFQGGLPPAVIHRRSKSIAIFEIRPFIHENLAALRATLLDGELTRNAFLDRSRVEAILADPDRSTDMDINYLLLFFDLEIWARKVKRIPLTGGSGTDPKTPPLTLRA